MTSGEYLLIAAHEGHMSTAILTLERGANYDSADSVSTVQLSVMCALFCTRFRVLLKVR